MLRPFWLHQVAEYLIGLALVAMGLQSPDPVVPTVAGGLIVINAAMVDGPLGAFRAVSRRTHRTIDLVLIIGLVVAAVAAMAGVDNASRVIMARGRRRAGRRVVELGVRPAAQPARTEPPVDRTEAIGRSAGRLAGHAAKAIRGLAAQRRQASVASRRMAFERPAPDLQKLIAAVGAVRGRRGDAGTGARQPEDGRAGGGAARARRHRLDARPRTLTEPVDRRPGGRQYIPRPAVWEPGGLVSRRPTR